MLLLGGPMYVCKSIDVSQFLQRIADGLISPPCVLVCGLQQVELFQ